ncbi:ankyrin repeat domain-containing protein 26-like [Myotis yumanensis]|uniref:ankyrin repeat domain-containing protein 26-like n=1 Tax=Myotis yumanensis TaxID=159337 RepID=UPI0038CF766D
MLVNILRVKVPPNSEHNSSTLKVTPSQHEKEDLKKYIESNIFLQQRCQQAVNTKNDLEKEKTRLKKLLKVAKQKLHECDNEELSFPGDSKPSPADMEIQSKKPKQKNDELTAKVQPSSSKCIPLDEKKTPLQQLAMEALLKECEELENTAKKWEQENVNLRTHMEMNMVESCVAEEYKKNIEERTGRDEVDKYKQINSFLQRLRESQEMSEQMINNQDAKRSYLELRNKELKSELSRVQDSRDDRKKELEKYVQLYQEQVKGRKLLENELTDFHRTQERLAEVRTELLLETQDNRRPVLTAPCVGNLNNSFLPRRNSTPRENLDSPTSRSYTLTFQKDIAGFVERPWKCSFLLNLLE